MDYTDLIGKTIFDFCKDKSILQKVLGFDVADEDRVSWYMGNVHCLNKIDDILQYFYLIKDDKVLKAALAYRDVLQEEFNQSVEQGTHNGIIVD